LFPSGRRTSVRVVLTTNQKGAIAEAAIAYAATKLGFGVLRPLADGERYDLVLDLRPTLVRVQCKWAVMRGQVIEVRTGTNRRGPDGFIRTTYRHDEIDAIAAYCEALDRCYLLSISLAAGRSAFYLRLAPSKNNQRLGVNWASDYELGAIAQLGERRHGMAEAVGSSPTSSTPKPPARAALF
jgi:PD-(D/E)XK nuclease superfamily protein